MSILTFTENFGTAFKTRVSAQTNTSYAGQAIPGDNGAPNQNIPGAIYNSESNFVFGPMAGGGTAGLADYGTRLKATFNNIPAGVRIFVSTTNVNNAATNLTDPQIPAVWRQRGQCQPNPAPISVMPNSSTVKPPATATLASPASSRPCPATDNGPNGGNVPIAEVSIANGTGTAVWEVVNTNPNTIESFKFAVYTTYVANVAQNTPLPGTSHSQPAASPRPQRPAWLPAR